MGFSSLLPDWPSEDSPCHCADCQWTGPASNLDAINDPSERLMAGETVPAGECPQCGCCAYLDSDLDQERTTQAKADAAAKMLRALRAARVYLGDNGTDDSPEAAATRHDVDLAIAAANAAGITDAEGDAAAEAAVLDGGAR